MNAYDKMIGGHSTADLALDKSVCIEKECKHPSFNSCTTLLALYHVASLMSQRLDSSVLSRYHWTMCEDRSESEASQI